MELAHINAQLEGQYGLHEAVKEVDKAIAFNYSIENGNAIAKLLEHKSKLFGLLVERVDIKSTFIDLKGALDEAKNRVLIQLNCTDRGILAPSLVSPAPDSIPAIPTPEPVCADPLDPSTSMDKHETASSLHQNDTSTDTPTQA